MSFLSVLTQRAHVKQGDAGSFCWTLVALQNDIMIHFIRYINYSLTHTFNLNNLAMQYI